jgi:glycosyltransferase involved in cell wall biosynthesis
VGQRVTEQRLPRVTVTIPTYNRAHLLPTVIRSVLDQTLTDIEVFVSDNASTDETRDVVSSFDDPRLHYLRNDTNIGVHANLSRGLQLGTAPFVSVLQDDDLMLPKNLERKVQVLEENPSVGLAHSAFQRILVDANGEETLQENVNWVRSEVDTIESGRTALRRLLTDRYFIPYTGVLFRRTTAEGERFEQEDGLADDVGFMLRVVRRSEAVAFIAEPLVATRFHPDALSAQEGVVDSGRGGFSATLSGLQHIKRVKKRFLDQYGHEVSDLRGLRAGSRRGLRDELLRRILKQTLPGRSPRLTLRLVGQAARLEPTILVAAETSRIVAMSLAGFRGRAAARRIVGRLRSR